MQSLAALPKPPAQSLPRGILKPPSVSEIPPHRQLPKIQVGRRLNRSPNPSPDLSQSSNSNSIASGSKVAVRTEEEQQAAAHETRERERRDARRKSLANRRVSFAAEATLHTFHDLDFFPDSTTSTRNNQSQLPEPTAEANPDEAPLLSTAAPEESSAQNSRRRQSSAASVAEDETAMSLYSDDSAIDAVEEIIADEDDGSTSSDDGTMMTVDDAEVTGVSAITARGSGDDNDDDTLRVAAASATSNRSRQAQHSDDLDDGEELIPAFVPWAKKNKDNIGILGSRGIQQPLQQSAQLSPLPPDVATPPQEESDDDSGMEMDVTQAVGHGILSGSAPDETMGMGMDMTEAIGQIMENSPTPTGHDGPSRDDRHDETMMDTSMDVTRAIGGIINSATPESSPVRVVAEPVEQPDQAEDEADMDMTHMVGGIQHQYQKPVQGATADEHNEDMSMELTTVMGGLLNRGRQALSGFFSKNQPSAVQTKAVGLGDAASAGQVDEIPAEASDDESTVNNSDDGMEITNALGGIIGKTPAEARAIQRQIMEAEADEPDAVANLKAASIDEAVGESQRSAPRDLTLSMTPSVVVTLAKTQATPQGSHQGSLRKRQTRSKTPERQNSPLPVVSHEVEEPISSPVRGVSPCRTQAVVTTPVRQNAALPVRRSPRRSKSPQKIPAITPVPKPSLFLSSSKTGQPTPSVILTPQKRTLSGVGADRAGLGSPKVAAMFDRRGSIGDASPEFKPVLNPPTRGVTFQDPRELEREEDLERRRQFEREDGRSILEREAVEGDPTLTANDVVREAPKKNFLRGRKSLHVGSAAGLLGKRPFELDSDDEDEGGVKRLKGTSPVKKAPLPHPDLRFKGRKKQMPHTDGLTTPISTPTVITAKTPSHLGYFKDIGHVGADISTTPLGVPNAALEEEGGSDDRIQLQDFLNMTSIRFMELNTTKRRNTIAPPQLGENGEENTDMTFESRVVAGAVTLPMLELYQHVSGFPCVRLEICLPLLTTTRSPAMSSRSTLPKAVASCAKSRRRRFKITRQSFVSTWRPLLRCARSWTRNSKTSRHTHGSSARPCGTNGVPNCRTGSKKGSTGLLRTSRLMESTFISGKKFSRRRYPRLRNSWLRWRDVKWNLSGKPRS